MKKQKQNSQQTKIQEQLTLQRNFTKHVKKSKYLSFSNYSKIWNKIMGQHL